VNVLINPSANASPGNYPILINVKDVFDNQATCELSAIIVDDPVLFELFEPENQAIVENENFKLDWSPSTFAQDYIITISLDENLDNEIFSDTLNLTEYQLPSIFEIGQIYYWRVTAVNRCGQMNSEIRSFSVEQTNSIQNNTPDGLNIYPNPTEHFIHFQDINNSLEQGNIIIHNIDGVLVHRKHIKLGSGTYSISVSDWAPGIYIISLVYHTHTQISRIVVQ